MTNYVGAIEAGGTKCDCAVVDSAQRIVSELRVPTTTPSETLRAIVEFFRAQCTPLKAIGVSSFGPLELDRSSPRYGFITATPKLAWRNADVLGPLREFNVPLAFDTDVNGAAYGEYAYGAARGLETFVYFTIGTGIGGGALVSGKPLHGLTHPEMGHMRIPRDPLRDPFVGHCPSHGDCFEGLASGPAIQARWGQDPSTLPAEHPAWELESRYIALALTNTICTLSPQRIILGGGVMQNEFLFPRIRTLVKGFLNSYIEHPNILEKIDSFIVPPSLGSRSGILGAAAMALATS